MKSVPWVSNQLITEILKECKNSYPTPSDFLFIKDLLSHIVINPLCLNAKLLSEREMACLFWIKQGKSINEIAILMQVKQSTIKSYRGSIKSKLKCKTLSEALFKSMQYKSLDHLVINHYLGDDEKGTI